MKELVYRDIFGNNPRKREVSIEEIRNLTGSRLEKKWICKYFVKERFRRDDKKALKALEKNRGCRKDCHILREVDTGTGENKIICKVLGEFFVIWGRSVYKILYINEIRIKFSKQTTTGRNIR